MTAVDIRILCAVSNFIVTQVKHKYTTERKKGKAPNRAAIGAQSCYRITDREKFTQRRVRYES